MQYIELTDQISISRLILGTWQFATNHEENSKVSSEAILSAYLSAGVTSITTANIYQGVEKKLGDFLEKNKTSFLDGALPTPQIFTVFTTLPDKLNAYTEADILREIDAALTRLNLSSLDLMQFFCWDADISVNLKVANALKKAIQQGKIKALGVTNVDVKTLEALLDNDIPIVSNQVQYSLLDRRAETAMIPFCLKHNIKLLPYGVMSGGLLSEKFLDQESLINPQNASEEKYLRTVNEVGGWNVFQQVLTNLNSIAKSLGVNITQLAASYILHQPTVAAIILGAHNTKRLDDNLAILNIELSDENLKNIREAIEPLDLIRGDIYESEIHYERTQGRLK